MSELFYGPGPQGQLLGTVHEFLDLEIKSGTIRPSLKEFIGAWEGVPEIFGAPVGLKDVALKMQDENFKVLVASVVLDDGNTSLLLDAAKAKEEPEDISDPFVEYFMDRFIPRLVHHSHSRCINLAIQREKLKQQQKETRLAKIRAATSGEIVKE